MEIDIPLLPNNESLQGILDIPANPKSLIIFAHGSGSNISSPRNKYVASVLNDSGFATLLLTCLHQKSRIQILKVRR